MKNFNINTNKLYILSGLSASGKSTFTKSLIKNGIKEDAIISTDTLRLNMLGQYETKDEFGIKSSLIGWDMAFQETFDIARKIIELRLSQDLPVFFDAVNATDKDRETYVNLAKKYNKEAVVVIFNVELSTLKERLSKRKERFDFKIVEKQNKIFERTSVFDHIIIDGDYTLSVQPNLLENKKTYVIGDVHGLLSEFDLLLNKINWRNDGSKFIDNLNESHLLFLGDIVDRGNESIELLKRVKATVESGKATLLLGNHEHKLIKGWDEYMDGGNLINRSLSSSETIMNFLALDEKTQIELISFLKSCPSSINAWVNESGELTSNEDEVKQKIGFCHSNSIYYNEFNFPKFFAMYGATKEKNTDNDLLYQENYNLGLNKSILIHGHVPSVSEQNNIFSLDENQAFAGNLVSLDFSLFVNKLKSNNWVSDYKIFKECVVKEKTEFNFNDKIKDKAFLLKEMSRVAWFGLVSDGIRKDNDGNKIVNKDGFKIYKYSKIVHFKKLWKTEKLLEKARGLVLDIAGNIVVHPFDKIYNFGEYNTGVNLDKNTKVQAIEKMNGFLGCISKHPFKDELFLSTTGSFGLEAPFVQFINELITDEQRDLLLKFLNKNNMTLMFEVIHPKDPHVIKYEDKDLGLYLIGAREKNINSETKSEQTLDIIANNIGAKRPKWKELTFNEVLTDVKKSELEGFMIRLVENNKPIMKIKTNYYLVTKFIGRMGGNMITMMYSKPEQFKKDKVEEEFYPIVDMLINKVSKEDFSLMTNEARIELVRGIIDQFRENVIQSPKIKI